MGNALSVRRREGDETDYYQRHLRFECVVMTPLLHVVKSYRIGYLRAMSTAWDERGRNRFHRKHNGTERTA